MAMLPSVEDRKAQAEERREAHAERDEERRQWREERDDERRRHKRFMQVLLSALLAPRKNKDNLLD